MIQFLGPIANLAGTWLEGKVETKKAETGAKVAKAKAEAVIMEKKATGEIDWDLKMADASAHSWKDEWLTILLSIPFLLCFISDTTREMAFAGFQALEQAPRWYTYSFGVVIAASFGIRSATKFFGGKK